MKFTEEQLKNYAAPLSESEDQKCIHAIEMVRDALKALGFTDDYKSISPLYQDTYAYALSMRSSDRTREIKIFIQGSYANNTNVRTESDVDIAIVQEEVFITAYRPGLSDASYGFHTAASSTKSFKDEVQECLEAEFGRDVIRGNISIKVNGNTYRKDADAVPCRRYRNYLNDYTYSSSNYIGGIYIYCDDGKRITNYPEQHVENGRKKNNDTNYYFKKMVRVAKKIKYIMADYGYDSAKKMSSFGLESLLWNIPDEIFMKYSQYRFIFDELIIWLKNDTRNISAYKEANGIKALCPTQNDIDSYTQFIADLHSFYQYDFSV